MNKTKLTTVLSLLISSVFTVNANEVVTLEQALSMAQDNDPWLHGNRLKQSAIENRSISAGTLPDPKVSVNVMNLPTDGFDFNQEAMTQFKVGVSQAFPKGESLSIKQRQLQTEASKYPLLRADRKAKVRAIVTELWLDAFLAQQTIELIEKDRSLFEQMAEVAKASYSNVIGKTRQQDVIRAQLELIQLEDRLTAQLQMYETSIARLNEWLHVYDKTQLDGVFDFESVPAVFKVANELPNIKLQQAQLMTPKYYSRNAIAHVLAEHPAIKAVSVKQKVSEQAITLTEQEYKSQWGVNASYGFRDDMPAGQSRADLFSVGVTFDVPLFTDNKQDKQVAAAIADAEAVKTEKLLLTKQMLSSIEKELRQLKRLNDRQIIYRDQLLKQTHEQAEASLTAYTNDDGDFSEVVRARIAELNAQISSLKINIDALKTIARINYFFTQSESKNTSTDQNSSVGE